MDRRVPGDGEWAWIGCSIVIGLLLCEIVGALFALARLLA